jgi:uncharacterized membrane protein
MLVALQRVLRHALYGARGGFLVRPLVIAFVLGACGVLLPWAEQASGLVERLVVSGGHFALEDASTAQGMLGTISNAVMTVVSIVLSVLLVALTLASMQFSPRILTAFVEDRASQRTIGVFLGTFLYCLGAYPTCRLGVRPSAYTVALFGATLLAMACTVGLVIFIHHIARSINVNFITERIAQETERIIDETMPSDLVGRVTSADHPLPTFDGSVIAAGRSGYIRFVDMNRLRDLATSYGVAVSVLRRVGQFVPAGVPLLRFSRSKTLDAEAFLEAVDVGPVRTMEQDVEFGALQLVDIALKAISPAVNDPSTAINCIDQLSRLLVRVATREPVPFVLFRPPGVARVVIPAVSFEHLLQVAFAQIVHYGRTDFAVSLRVMRALGDITTVTTDRRYLHALEASARGVATECLAHLPETSHAEVRARLQTVLDQAARGTA